MIELNMYMASILSLPTAVSESDIIYTFLHCLIRDEQDMVKLSEGEGGREGGSEGGREMTIRGKKAGNKGGSEGVRGTRKGELEIEFVRKNY